MTYDTHLPVLEFLFGNFTLNSVLELGVGDASTPFLALRAKKLISVESDIGWQQKFKHDVRLGSALDFAKNNHEKYDLVFIDSNPASERSKCVEALLPWAAIIVAHDTEPESEWNYNYNSVKLPHSYVRLDYDLVIPWTSIFTCNHDVIEEIKEWLHALQTNR